MIRRTLAAALVVISIAAQAGAAAPPQEDTVVGLTGTVYAGMYSSEWEATTDFTSMSAWAGKKITFAGTFHHVLESENPCPFSATGCWFKNTAWTLEQAWDAQATPVANLTIDATAASIASGAWDDEIVQWANRVKTWTVSGYDGADGPQRTLFIAPLQEHNGDWVQYGCDPVNFKLAYARIRSLAQGVGLDETLVRWVWAPNGWTSDKGACKGKTLADYYPGSDIVDVIGYSAYRWLTNGSLDPLSYTTGPADDLRAIDPTKPYLVLQTAAWGTGTGSGVNDQWIRDLFTWAAADPNVVGVVWFNFDNTFASPPESDWRVWNSATDTGLSQGWRDALSATSTIHAWPLTAWFQPGPLVVAEIPGPCPDGAVCDTAVFVTAQGQWHRRSGLASGDPVATFYFGVPGDFPFTGDWDCDGTKTPGLYRQSDGFVYLRNSNTTGPGEIVFFLGNPGDIPIAGDFDGDGCDTLSVYRPSQGRVFITDTLGAAGGYFVAERDFYFGNPGDVPFVGDFDGDGIDTVGLYRISTGFVYFRNTLDQGFAHFSFFYGAPGDRIVAGDWDGDGDDTVAVYRPSTRRFYVNLENVQSVADYTLIVGNFAFAARG